jgi:hypothetical protein
MNNDHKHTPETYTPPTLTVVGGIEELTQTGGHGGQYNGSITDPKPSGCPWHGSRSRWWCWWCN